MPLTKTILVCPLNWGLGHASRDIYIIRQLLRHGFRVIIGGDRSALFMLTSEFPGLPSVRIPDISIRYSRILPAWLVVIFQLPVIIAGIIREHFLLVRIIRTTGADIILSDNRYGLWNRKVTSVLITHQLSPKLPAFLKILESFLSRLIRFMCKPFDYCWIPDIPDLVNLSGSLSSASGLSVKIRYTGILSRFMDIPVPIGQPDRPVLLIILSGPEPQRSLLQDIMITQVNRFPGRSLIVAGEPQKEYSSMITRQCRMVSSLKTIDMLSSVHSARYIICRSGYSGIMDLVSLGKKALLIPTPGQTEQEYLAGYLESAGFYPFMKQQEFDITSAVNILDSYPFKSINADNRFMDRILQELMTCP